MCVDVQLRNFRKQRQHSIFLNVHFSYSSVCQTVWWKRRGVPGSVENTGYQGLIRPKVSFDECLGLCFVPAAVTPCFPGTRAPRTPGTGAPVHPVPRLLHQTVCLSLFAVYLLVSFSPFCLFCFPRKMQGVNSKTPRFICSPDSNFIHISLSPYFVISFISSVLTVKSK